MQEIEKDVAIENLSYKVICMLADFKKISDYIEDLEITQDEMIDNIRSICNDYKD